MKNIVSIIVPVYNVEAYLDKCLDSLVNQTYSNIEIILVDDGSTDSSSQKCDNWRKKDKRIKVVHKENGGLSDARNKGISVSTGEYICFVDSDDYIDSKYVELLYNAIMKNKTNISQCGIKYVDDAGKDMNDVGYNKDICLSGIEMLQDVYNGHYVENVVAWNRLYKREMIDNFLFPKGRIHEDEYTTYKLLYFEKKVSIVKEKLYYYRQSNNSITRSSFKLRRLDIIDAYKEKIEFYNANDCPNLLMQNTVNYYLYILRDLYYKVKKYFPKEKKKLEIIKSDYKECINKYKNIKKVGGIKNKLFEISPTIYGLLKQFKK